MDFGRWEKSYYWYDTPNGEDIIDKWIMAGKGAYLCALPVYIFDYMYSQPKTVPEMGVRFLSITAPAVGMATMFTLTSQFLCKEFPQVNPTVHYAAGGFAAGTIIGAAKKSVSRGFVAGCYLSIIGAAIQIGHEEEWPNLWGGNYKRQPASGNVFPNRFDWSFTKDNKDLPPPMATPGF